MKHANCKHLWATTVAVLLSFVIQTQQAWSQGEPITFSVTGDIPYSTAEIPILETQMANHNLYSPSEFLAHVGDLNAHDESCQEVRYLTVADLLKNLAVPAYIVPGDNEWTDCSDPAQAWQWWDDSFRDFEQFFCGTPQIERQAVRHENFAFVQKGVLFIGINIPNGDLGPTELATRLQDDADWVDFQYNDKGSQVRGAVVFGHAGPATSRDLFFDQFVPSSAAFGKPVLYAMGNRHTWRWDQPWSSGAPNVRRMTVNRGGFEDPVQLTVTMDPNDMFQFLRNPWSGSPQPFNAMPCVEAGVDQTIFENESASIDGAFTDDGVPQSPGSVTTTWSQISGPGVATFVDPNALSTTVSFDLPGTYDLELMADDSELQGRDTLTVIVDAIPAIAINDINVSEGDAGTVVAAFTISLSTAGVQNITVDYATADGTAVSGSDYQSASGTVSFSPGITTLPLNITVNGDVIDEINENFFVDLSNASNATVADNQGEGTILDDDAAPTISINDVSVTEGNSGTVTAGFTVSLSAASSQSITVDYATANGTATSGSDYQSASGTVTFSAGVTTQPVDVTIDGDVIDEINENFFVDLSNASNATIADNQGEGTILDDDAAPTISINDVSVTEGNSGTVTAGFTVSLSVASSQSITVDYATANGTAISGSDYQSASGTVTFSAGVTTQPVDVTIDGDVIDEINENFFVNLSNASNATIADNQGEGTILDDDAAPTISINDVSVTEGNSGTVTAGFTVSLSAASSQSITVDYATANGTATSGSDYQSASGTVTFSAGVTTQPVDVTVNGDVVDENNENFFVDLSNASNATIADNQGEGTILDDDAAPTISINDVSVTEGNSGTVTAGFTVSLSAASSQSITVDYSTANGTATSGSDYLSASGTVTFSAGVTTQPVDVTVNGDVIDENNENFFVDLSNASNATIADNQGEGTILDDDNSVLSLSINDIEIIEGNGESVIAAFTVSLSAVTDQKVGVAYKTSDGTATGNVDYRSISGELVFLPGETTKIIEILIRSDLEFEEDETFFVNLGDAINATIADDQGQCTILNDDIIDNDILPELSINDIEVTEGDDGIVTAAFTVSLSDVANDEVVVSYETSNGTATAGGDYTSTSGEIVFNPGEITATIEVAVAGDLELERDETFFVNLGDAINATIEDEQGQCTIIDDDDSLPTLSVNDIDVNEGSGGSVIATFTVSLSAVIDQKVGVSYKTSNGTATGGVDYKETSGEIVFLPGTTAMRIQVPVDSDLELERDETFFVNLGGAINATIEDEQGQCTIIDDDVDNESVPELSINDIDVNEGDDGSVIATFTVSLSAVTDQKVGVSYKTSNGTATGGLDYKETSGEIVFLPGTATMRIEVAVDSDLELERDETFFVNLGDAINATIADDQGQCTIIDDDVELEDDDDDIDPNENLALNKSIKASSSQSDRPVKNANDGNSTTFWRSLAVDLNNPEEWVAIDLVGEDSRYSSVPVGRVKISWKGAYAKSYAFQTSNDAATWTTVYSTTNGAGGVEEFTVSSGPVRYVRVLMTLNRRKRYAVKEIEIYSGEASTSLTKSSTTHEHASNSSTVVPKDVSLGQNYPNPFNPATTISFSIPNETHVSLKVYNMMGREVATLVKGIQQSGTHQVLFNATKLPSGTYFSVLKANGRTQTGRLVLLK